MKGRSELAEYVPFEKIQAARPGAGPGFSRLESGLLANRLLDWVRLVLDGSLAVY